MASLLRHEILCQECSVYFRSQYATSKYCDICSARVKKRQQQAEYHRHRTPPVIYPIRLCDICKQEFRPKSKSHRLCSDACRDEDSRLDDSDRFYLFERDFFRCVYCGRSSIEHGVILHADHIHPKSKGGKDIAANLVTACSQCNLAKHAHQMPKCLVKRVAALVTHRNQAKGIPDGKFIKLASSGTVEKKSDE